MVLGQDNTERRCPWWLICPMSCIEFCRILQAQMSPITNKVQWHKSFDRPRCLLKCSSCIVYQPSFGQPTAFWLTIHSKSRELFRVVRSLYFLSVSYPGLGCICHCCCYLFSFLYCFLFIPLLFKEPHFLYKLKRTHILKQILDLLVVSLLQISVLLVGNIQLLLVLLVHLRCLLLIQQVVLLQVSFIFFLGFAHLAFVVLHRLLILLLPFSIISINNSLHGRRRLSQALLCSQSLIPFIMALL